MILKDIEFNIVRSRRKTVSIEVGRDLAVTVRAPLKISEKEILSFMESRYELIKKAIQKQSKRADFYNISEDELKRLKALAKEVIPNRVEHYSKIMNLKPTGVKINAAKTRFGSCSGKNSLNFSAYLMLFSNDAIDYVVVHELAHIKHHNHSKAFYDLIEYYMPDYKKRAALLKIK